VVVVKNLDYGPEFWFLVSVPSLEIIPLFFPKERNRGA